MLTHLVRNTAQFEFKTHHTFALRWRDSTLPCSNLASVTGFHSLPFQQFQTLLTLFPKSFSSFPHGTCLISVSSLYSALDEIYHRFGAPLPRNVTLRKHAVHRGRQMTRRILTRNDALSQEASTCASIGNASLGYNSRPEAQIFKLSLSLFVRHY